MASPARSLSQESLSARPPTQRTDPDAASVEAAVQRAGRWLALRPRTERELTTRLLEGGFGPDVVHAALDRLKDLRLVDDPAFAAQWIEERARRKHLSAAALGAELRAKGIDKDAVDAALQEAGVDEEAQARDLALKTLRRLGNLPLEIQARRLHAALLRKGFSAESTQEAMRAVLPPEGWD